MLIDVLTRLAADTGFDPEQQRSALVNIINSGSTELYNMLNCNSIHREVTLVVPPDSVVALPNFIGQLKGMRMHTNELPFDLAALAQPRYTANTLAFKFKNWRDLGESALHTLPVLIGPLTFKSPRAEGCVISINGQTNQAAQLEETIVMNDTVVSTGNLFGPQINRIACVTPRIADITIYDADENELAVLYNSSNRTRYKLVDVSQVFWTLDSQDGRSLIDVCYKLPLLRLTNDTDSFAAGDDYDNALYWMSMWVYLNPLQGRGDEATAAKMQAIQASESAKNGAEREIVKKVFWGRNRFYGIFRKYRYFPGSVTSVDHNVQS